MRFHTIIQLSGLIILFACANDDKHFGETEIVKWKDNKIAAISITYDDATINQFRSALPIMDTLGFKGTFFINTADIPGSQFPPRYFGTALQQVVKASSSLTDKNNLFERASALRFLNIDNAVAMHNQAGA